MRELIILTIVIMLTGMSSNLLFSQERIITFNNYGQREIVKKNEQVSIAYDGLNPERVYLSYELHFNGDYTLEAKLKPIDKTTEEILEQLEKVYSILTSCTGEPPVLSKDKFEIPNREIIFKYIGDTAHALPCEKINIDYEKSVNRDDVYILYRSEDWGYTLELASKKDFRTIILDKLCQVVTTANPNLVTVVVPYELRLEQIIWTPLVNGYWELRLGNVNRGCISKGLDRIDKLRRETDGYLDQVPVDKMNHR